MANSNYDSLFAGVISPVLNFNSLYVFDYIHPSNCFFFLMTLVDPLMQYVQIEKAKLLRVHYLELGSTNWLSSQLRYVPQPCSLHLRSQGEQ